VEGSGDRPKWIVLAVFGLIAVGIVAAILIGRSGGGDDSTAAASASGCKQVEAPAPKKVSYGAPEQTVSKGEKLTAVVDTSCGTFEIGLDAGRAPKTVNSFVFLTEKGFYDGLAFHRVVPEFVIQGGDPLGTGSGGPDYSVDEKPPANLAYTKGVVAMAKSPAEPPRSLGQPVLRRLFRRCRPAARIRAHRQGREGLRRGRTDRRAGHAGRGKTQTDGLDRKDLDREGLTG
jgi:Cyclophilin type peptidyl-prolyl cis-trans isomerase/CLD